MGSAAKLRLTTEINLAGVNKRQGCNYKETEGQRDGRLFAAAWTAPLSEEQNGIICHRGEKLFLLFVPCLSTCPFTLNLLLWSDCSQDNGLPLLMATLHRNILYSFSYLKVSPSLTCTQI